MEIYKEKKNLKLLNDIAMECINIISDNIILKDWQKKALSEYTYRFSNARSGDRFIALCNSKTKLITINRGYFYFANTCRDVSEIKTALIHEMLHAILRNNIENSYHTGQWLQYADVITNNTEYDVSAQFLFSYDV